MMENDDRLIKQFFAENKQEIADNGFSKRVIQTLPKRRNHSVEVLNAITIAACIILFTLADGWQILWGNLQGFFIAAIKTGAVEVEPMALIGTGVVLVCLLYNKIMSMEY